MTRLKEEWIIQISESLKEYDEDLIKKTGLSLLELSAKANNISPDRILAKSRELKFAAVPVKSGKGIIGSFSQSIASIIMHMGFPAFVTSASDVEGIFEAKRKGANGIFIADDNRYIGLNWQNGLLAENDESTARGYIAALESMVGSLKNEKILVLGYGRLGKKACEILAEKQVAFAVYDNDKDRLKELESTNLYINEEEIKDYRLLFDATNHGNWLDEDKLHKDFILSAPGIPPALTAECTQKYKERLVHDNLQLGTAVMLGALCK